MCPISSHFSFSHHPSIPPAPRPPPPCSCMHTPSQHRYTLYQRMLSCIALALEAASWPPPLTRKPQSQSQQQQQGEGPMSEAEEPGTFHGFGGGGGGGGGGGDGSLLARINGLMACMNRLQVWGWE